MTNSIGSETGGFGDPDETSSPEPQPKPEPTPPTQLPPHFPDPLEPEIPPQPINTPQPPSEPEFTPAHLPDPGPILPEPEVPPPPPVNPEPQRTPPPYVPPLSIPPPHSPPSPSPGTEPTYTTPRKSRRGLAALGIGLVLAGGLYLGTRMLDFSDRAQLTTVEHVVPQTTAPQTTSPSEIPAQESALAPLEVTVQNKKNVTPNQLRVGINRAVSIDDIATTYLGSVSESSKLATYAQWTPTEDLVAEATLYGTTSSLYNNGKNDIITDTQRDALYDAVADVLFDYDIQYFGDLALSPTIDFDTLEAQLKKADNRGRVGIIEVLTGEKESTNFYVQGGYLDMFGDAYESSSRGDSPYEQGALAKWQGNGWNDYWTEDMTDVLFNTLHHHE